MNHHHNHHHNRNGSNNDVLYSNNEDDLLIRDGREIVDSIVASLNLHHASSSPEHRAEWDELLRMQQNTPTPSSRPSQRSLQESRRSHSEQRQQQAMSTSSRSVESAGNSPHRGQQYSGHQHQHSASSRTSNLQAMVQPDAVQGGSSSSNRASPALNPVVGERSSSIFATSPSRRMELSRAGSSGGGGRDGSSSSATTRIFSNEARSASSSRPRRLQHVASTEPTMLDSSRSRTVQKDSDGPSTPIAGSSSHGFSHTPASLTKLLGANMSISPVESREHSYNHGNANLTRRTNLLDGATLPDHLYTQGLLAGRHSDIRILAFGNEYNLHRLILDRAPFFTLALSEPWSESKADEIVLQPDLVDQAITQNAFELALKRLYGCDISEEEDAEAIGLFATGRWLEMQELIDSSVDSILRQMEPENLSLLIKLVTNNYYGRPGERILSSAKAMLCRDGWDMPLKHWDAIPGRIVNEVVSSDGFYVYGEWERWNHAKRLFDRRLRQVAIELGMLESKQSPRIRAPSHLVHELARFSPHTTTSATRPLSKGSDVDDVDNWYSLYMHPDVESIADLLDDGLHYLHMEFEHLQYIKQSRDVFGLPVVPEAIVSNALFQQLELRQRVVNAQQTDLELGLTQQVVSDDAASGADWLRSKTNQETITSPRTGHQVEIPALSRFWIPSEDCTMVTGGTPNPIISLGSTAVSYTMTDSSARQSNLSWLDSRTQSQPLRTTDKASGDAQAVPTSSSYSTVPPFRFSAEFPSPRLLKEKKRVYSRTVFYAGSYWNIYIQKMRSVKQNYQLGVYLHRAKDREQDEVISTGPNFGAATVDERIGSLEREMLLRGGDRGHLPRHSMYNSNRLSNAEQAMTGATNPTTQDVSRDTIASAPAAFSSNQDRNAHSRFSDATLQTHILFESDSEDDEANTHAPVDFDAQPDLAPSGKPHPTHNMPFSPPRISTLPSYTDTRPTIRTYFKIYSPSKAGRLLSVYESAPDQFDFSQSWGWRSSTLMLDEGFGNTDGDEDPLSSLARKNRNGALRFSVVIGNL